MGEVDGRNESDEQDHKRRKNPNRWMGAKTVDDVDKLVVAR